MTQKRPASFTVFGILSIVFGGLTLLCFGCALAMEPMMRNIQAQQGQQVGLDKASLEKLLDERVPGYAVVRWVGLGFNAFLPALLVVVGIMLLRVSPAAKSLCIVWSVIAILYLLFSQAYNIAYVNGPSAEILEEHFKKQNLPMGDMFNPTFFAVAGIIGAVFMMIYPICLLVFALLPSTSKALAGAGDAGFGAGTAEDYYDPEFERRRREPPAET
jgi:hypothetical protein